MLFITQLIYVRPGSEDIFDQFEKLAIPIIYRYNGKLLLRVRPDKDAFLESNMEQPYEFHLAEFPTETDFNNFMEDEERKTFLYLKEQSVRSVVLIKGTRF